MEQTLFAELINQQLSAVIFVQDYLQLDFDGNRMTMYEWPTLRMPQVDRSFGELEYRNDLCGFIARKISSVVLRENEYLTLEFHDTSASIELNLSTGREAMYYVQYDGNWLSL
ncbi:hypothetical protein [Hymenobacter metallicola]|uniref:Uncharacterized protein n=1 Tax=Hymenobacter metallicola TaxID=2563114 RepID=A0A4Z0QDF8_9BACT|nr:hypothetical protein [Hymenobacter metallicola]TGE28087.1 hypothetical protein E5K02_01070 [Hymenobacter metallicola]